MGMTCSCLDHSSELLGPDLARFIVVFRGRRSELARGPGVGQEEGQANRLECREHNPDIGKKNSCIYSDTIYVLTFYTKYTLSSPHWGPN